jgi:Prokaryotic N-terminal methylation motif
MLTNKRKALTLLEVLISIFIMGIGMLSVLALFPAAADMMSRAIKNYQTAEALINAAAINDGVDFYSSYKSLMTPVVPDATAVLGTGPNADKVASIVLGNGTINNWYGNNGAIPPDIIITGGGGSGATAVAVLGTASNNSGVVISVTVLSGGSGYTSPPTVTFKTKQDNPQYLFLDQVLVSSGGIASSIKAFGNIPVWFVNAPNITEKFFVLNSDLPIDGFGRAEKPPTSLGKYSISFLLEKPKPLTTPNFTRRYALVFKDRDSVGGLSDYTTSYPVVTDFANNPSNITINNVSSKTFSTRQWLMVTSDTPAITPVVAPTHVRFVEIRSINEVPSSTTPGNFDYFLEISPPLIQNVNKVFHLREVLWVAYLGV